MSRFCGCENKANSSLSRSASLRAGSERSRMEPISILLSAMRMSVVILVGQLSKGQGFGLGVSVTRNSAEAGGLDCVGSFGWGGFWYTTFFVDPKKRMVGICMAQLHPDGGATLNNQIQGPRV